MKREIKFRGLRSDSKKWVYGDLIQYRPLENKILESNYGQWDILEGGYDVIKESVGQFTGLQDKNGVDIYEGDIFHYRGNIFKVTLKGDKYGLGVLDVETCSGIEMNKHYGLYLISFELEVIGNIHES